MNYTMGVNEFADMIGAPRPDVSRAISVGLIRAKCGPNARGPGSKILSLKDAEIISAAVRCGIPWLVAVGLVDNLRPFQGGIILLEGSAFERKDTLMDDPKAFVRDVLARHKLAPGALAEKVGISASTLTRALNDPHHKFKFSLTTLRKIKEWDNGQSAS